MVHGAVLLLGKGQYRQVIASRLWPKDLYLPPVGAKLARDENNPVLLKPRRLYREQALLLQDDTRDIVYKPQDLSGTIYLFFENIPCLDVTVTL
ncbi:hypothetical protein CFII68_12802 [Pseudomonas sp. CFII68]|nr:hypothetical protein CFII68_12802 [Pseudomonas sp. CFII68]